MLICILGNSHAAALKHGWDRIGAGFPDVDAHFFTMLGQNLGRLELTDGRLALPKGGGSFRTFPKDIGDSIDIAAYDGFILHGLGLRVRPPKEGPWSQAVRACAAADAVRDTAMWKLVSDIRSVSAAPVRVGHTPLLAADAVHDRGASDALREYLSVISAIIAEAPATLVPQPDETIVNGVWTDPQFNTDVTPIGRDPDEKDGQGQRHSDNSHMNPAFGALMLERFLRSF
ncbi:MAG: hypothetical protein KDK24_18780 [Pseudooceanicola sp.]|nr:hypothetical protein [Pseudooceanicola sp.]